MKKALIWDWLNQGGAAALALYKGEDQVLLSGSGTNDYLSFTDKETDCFTYREGSDHNQTSIGSRIIYRSLSGATMGSIVEVATGDADFNVTDPSLVKLSNGKIIVFYCRIANTGSPAPRTQYYQESNDGGLTFDGEVLLYSEQGPGGTWEGRQLNGPGKADEWDGFVYKPLYGTANPVGGSRRGLLFRSPIDTISWTLLPVDIWIQDNDDGEEPCIYIIKNGAYAGRFLVTQRSDTVDEARLFYSDDQGGSWTGPISIGFPSIGKSPICGSDDGTVFMIMGRWNGQGGRPMFTWTKDPSGIAGWSAPQQVSVRTSSWMYGGISWDTDRFVSIWAQGVLGENIPSGSGPTLLIRKEFIPSLTAVAEPTEYTEEYQSILDYPQGLGATMPSTALKALENQLIVDLKADGIFDLVDHMVVYRKKNAALGAYALYNWKTAHLYTGTLVNAPTYGVGGYKPNGSTSYINLQWPPGDGVNYLQDDAGVYIYVNEDVEVNGTSIGASTANFSTQQRGPMLFPHFTDDKVYWKINDSTNSDGGAGVGAGGYLLQRRGAADKRLWKNGVQVATATTASQTRGAVKILVGATNFNNASVNLYNAAEISAIVIGASFTGLEAQLHTRIAAFITAVDAL